MLDVIQQKTTLLLTTLTKDLDDRTSSVLNDLPLLNISDAGETYVNVVNSLRSSLISEYGSLIPLTPVKRFHMQCKSWDRELSGLAEEYNGIQEEIRGLAQEIGIGNGVDKTVEDNDEFNSLLAKIKGEGRKWVDRMDKLEKVRSFYPIQHKDPCECIAVFGPSNLSEELETLIGLSTILPILVI